MNLNKLKGFGILILLFSISFLMSCDSDDGQISCNPEYMISVSINVNYPLYNEVETRGWTYIGGEGTGTRGIILVKTNSGYKAYDRNAPHICPTPNSTLEVIDDIKLFCPEDGAEWIMLTGEPILIANRAPRVYTAIRNGDNIIIRN